VTTTGERVVTASGGFNPTYQRHVAAYREAAQALADGPVLDVGAGVGHSYALLDPRPTTGIDLDPGALAGQARPTVVGDMRALPFADDSFASVVAVHSIEHVPDPERALTEAARVLKPGGRAYYVTPNRLTFGRPDEIVDPYHYIEWDADQFRDLLLPHFASVHVYGLFGSDRYEALVAREKRVMDAAFRLDRFRLRRRLSRRARQRLYDGALSVARLRHDPAAAAITPEDFFAAEGPLDAALDLIAVCAAPE
jgi:SAM-dependent methyltransferase